MEKGGLEVSGTMRLTFGYLMASTTSNPHLASQFLPVLLEMSSFFRYRKCRVESAVVGLTEYNRIDKGVTILETGKRSGTKRKKERCG